MPSSITPVLQLGLVEQKKISSGWKIFFFFKIWVFWVSLWFFTTNKVVYIQIWTAITNQVFSLCFSFSLFPRQALLSLFYLCSSNIFALINYVGFATWVTIINFTEYLLVVCKYVSFNIAFVIYFVYDHFKKTRSFAFWN